MRLLRAKNALAMTNTNFIIPLRGRCARRSVATTKQSPVLSHEIASPPSEARNDDDFFLHQTNPSPNRTTRPITIQGLIPPVDSASSGTGVAVTAGVWDGVAEGRVAVGVNVTVGTGVSVA